MSPPTARVSSTAKRCINHASDSSAEPSSPAAKSTRRKESSSPEQRVPAQPTEPLREASSLSAPPPPAFAPRADYVKLLFKDNPSVDIKLRWLTEVNRAFRLDRNLAEVKMAAITSRFVYISRRRSDIVGSVTKGEILYLSLEIQDTPERPRKFPTYLITRYPVYTDPALAKELQGIYTARRFYQNGTPINRLVVTWSLPHPPPLSIAFSFLPCLPSCEFRRMKDEQPRCYRCWNSGHISRYCSALERCAYCSESHDSWTCPHRTPLLHPFLPLTQPRCSHSLRHRTPRSGNAPDVTSLESMLGILAARAAGLTLHQLPHAGPQARYNHRHLHPTVPRPLPQLPMRSLRKLRHSAKLLPHLRLVLLHFQRVLMVSKLTSMV